MQLCILQLNVGVTFETTVDCGVQNRVSCTPLGLMWTHDVCKPNTFPLSILQALFQGRRKSGMGTVRCFHLFTPIERKSQMQFDAKVIKLRAVDQQHIVTAWENTVYFQGYRQTSFYV